MIQDGKVVTRIDLDVSIPDVQKSVSIMQGDNKRRWVFSLSNGGEPFVVPPRWTAILTGTKPDGTIVYNGTIVEDGRIIYDFSSGGQLSTAVGSYPVQLEIYGYEGELVFSPKLWVAVFPNVSAAQVAQSSSEFTAMSQFVENINEVKTRLDAAEGGLDTAEGRLDTAEGRLDTAEGKAEGVDELLENIVEALVMFEENVRTAESEIERIRKDHGSSISVGMDKKTYSLSIALMSEEGAPLSVGTVDLPLESLIMGASYADGVLSLKIKTEDGSMENSTVHVNISDIVRGLVSEKTFQAEIRNMKKGLERVSDLAELLGKEGHSFANSLRGSKSGAELLLEDVSPFEHTIDIEIRSKNLFNKADWADSLGEVEVNGINCLNVREDEKGYYEVPGSASDAYMFTVQIYRNSDNDKATNLKAITQDGSVRTVIASTTLGVKRSVVVYGGEKLYFTGWGRSDICIDLSVTQLEVGAVATEFSPYVSDVSAVKVLANGVEYSVKEDGTVDGDVKSKYPETAISTDAAGVLIDCKYNRDTNKAFTEMYNAIISLGGNV